MLTDYYAEFSTDEPVFAPWEGHPAFEELYRGVEEHTLVSRDRCYMLAALAGYASHLEGDAAESGVYTGGTALLIARALGGRTPRLYLFDSFEGLPPVDPVRDAAFHEGQFAVDSLESVERLLEEHADLIDVRKGWMPDTFAGLEDVRYAFAHVDVDLYRSALDCCEYFYPRLVPGGIIVFDEYGCAEAQGEREAVDQFFAGKPEAAIVLPTGQAIIIRLPQPWTATEEAGI